MSPELVSLLVFLAVVTAVGAIALVVRDVRAGRRSLEVAASGARRVRLQRIKPQAEGPGEISVAGFDRWFNALLEDSGLEWNPTAAALLLVLWGALCGIALFSYNERFDMAVAAGLIAVPLPLVYLIARRSRRLAKLQDQLPPALDTLARSIRAGQTLEQAIGLLGDHSPDPLAKEFRWCSKQMDMGLALPAVMRSLVRRVRLYDVRILATTLIVHRQMGGNVVNVLERLSQVIRDRLNSRRQLRATTAAGRMSAGFVSLVTPGVFLYFVFFRPEYVSEMLQSTLGQTMLLVAVILEIVGLVWMARLLRAPY
jgi:tight adherence protein B